MGTLKWYKRDPRAALLGMASMSNEEVGAYNRILDLLYVHDGKIDDDPSVVCRWLNCRAQRWRYLRDRLIALKKIYVLDGCLRNERTDRELVRANGVIAKRKMAAAKRWNKLPPSKTEFQGGKVIPIRHSNSDFSTD